MSISSYQVKEQSEPLLSPAERHKRQDSDCCRCTLRVQQTKQPPGLSALGFFFSRKSMGSVCEWCRLRGLVGTSAPWVLLLKKQRLFSTLIVEVLSSWQGSAAQTGGSCGHLSLRSAGDTWELFLLSSLAVAPWGWSRGQAPCSVPFLSALVNALSSEQAPALVLLPALGT